MDSICWESWLDSWHCLPSWDAAWEAADRSTVTWTGAAIVPMMKSAKDKESVWMKCMAMEGEGEGLVHTLRCEWDGGGGGGRGCPFQVVHSRSSIPVLIVTALRCI